MGTKVCTKCNLSKNNSEFCSKRAQCKSCRSVINAQNRLKIGSEYFKKKGAKWYKEHQSERIVDVKLYRAVHKKEIAIYKKEYRRLNRDTILKYGERWRKENQKWIKQWNITHRYVYNAISAKRRARLLKATPHWLTQAQLKEIEEFYTLAQELAWLNQDGKPHHVDHIVPLQGKEVSGLHVPWNLQLLPAIQNIKKSNIF